MNTAALKGKLAFFIKTESFTSYDPEIAMFPRKTVSSLRGPRAVPRDAEGHIWFWEDPDIQK